MPSLQENSPFYTLEEAIIYAYYSFIIRLTFTLGNSPRRTPGTHQSSYFLIFCGSFPA